MGVEFDRFFTISESETVSELKPVDQKSLELSKQMNTKLPADKEPTSPTITPKCETKETSNFEITDPTISNSKTGNHL